MELFTSQGCSSCPPANATLSAIADRPDILALSFGVTYWDDLGWKDTFASPQFTARQWDYGRGLHHTQVWTPQMVIDGRLDSIGRTPAEIAPLLRAAKALRPAQPHIEVGDQRVAIGSAKTSHTAQVWLVRYDPRLTAVPVRRGENGGKTLPHRNVVHELTKLGVWTGQPVSFVVSPSRNADLRSAVLLQAGAGGPILAAG